MFPAALKLQPHFSLLLACPISSLLKYPLWHGFQPHPLIGREDQSGSLILNLGSVMGEAVIYLLFGSVVGPALTFRIRHNEQNLSLADVTQQAGKYFLAPALVVYIQTGG